MNITKHKKTHKYREQTVITCGEREGRRGKIGLQGLRGTNNCV